MAEWASAAWRESTYNRQKRHKQSSQSDNAGFPAGRTGGAFLLDTITTAPTDMFTRLREDIATIRERDPAARSAWEVLTCYPGLHALVLHRVAHACWRAKRYWLARVVSQIGRFLTGIEIHPGATVGRRVFIDHGMGVVIGETAVIGDDCTIYQGVTLGGTSLTRGAKRHPTLERGVIVGAGAKVLGGFTVGADAKIGSNAVVVKPVPAGGTAVGNPARVIAPARAAGGSPKPAAGRPEFCAYGITPNADDPVSLAIHGLINHAANQSQRIDEIVAALERLGTSLEALQGADAALFDLRRLSAALEGKLEPGAEPH
ncbi:2,3,4,5-tetrahydropyridine-2,6-dicarboxylate N-acetyltransferase [Paraburkholderia humisilvae]|uniref:Serine acetyltransferase n=2 Tax=Paraburkholderia humisilvae TaxID=627669 RepID=A0A6J5D051_9BURK|nr:2,3,4,5-tetrahydropyridine-2,6-dicarboxylate N-acetyltransferase [Paraburkholderia humisilvae]